jgi:hypothetical protein
MDLVLLADSEGDEAVLDQAEEELKERKENLQFENNQFNQFAYLKK